MLILIATLCILVSFGLLIWTSLIDLKEWILPDEITLAFAVLGIVFHFVTSWSILSPLEMLIGAIMGGGTLYVIRAAANAYYGRDTLGLGDVKLLLAGGLWVGGYNIMLGLAMGAFAGMIIGLIFLAFPHEHPDDIKPEEGDGLLQTAIPAGPGFAFGIFAAIIWMVYEWHGLPQAIETLKGLV